jgi:hypothetical protein
VRIRENQRRSRNRRKELIEDLQKRVLEHERQGVAATQDMQRAARRVADENLRLRSLLARHGVLQDEVESYLRSFHEEPPGNDAIASAQLQSGTAADHLSVALGTVQSPKHTRLVGHEINNDTNIAPVENRTRGATTTSSRPEATEPIHMNQDQATISASRPTELHNDLQDSQASNDLECPNTTDCFCPPTTKFQLQPLEPGLEISCERAAAIITEMRGDADLESIRASLGCAGRKECNVRNSTVLQIMDED